MNSISTIDTHQDLVAAIQKLEAEMQKTSTTKMPLLQTDACE